VADEVPPYLHVGSGVEFLQGFLDFVFAEFALTGLVGLADGVDAERLGDGDERDVGGGPAGAARGLVDPGPNCLEVLGDPYLRNPLSASKLSLASLTRAAGPFGASFK
jgi:hypothetical protein